MSEVLINKDYREIFNLAGMLVQHDIPFEAFAFMNGLQIAYPSKSNNRICSVVEHDGSYGHDTDTLEIMGLLTDEESELDGVCGYLSAREVFLRIQADWEKHFK